VPRHRQVSIVSLHQQVHGTWKGREDGVLVVGARFKEIVQVERTEILESTSLEERKRTAHVGDWASNDGFKTCRFVVANEGGIGMGIPLDPRADPSHE
jgi:hypothetical protein